MQHITTLETQGTRLSYVQKPPRKGQRRIIIRVRDGIVEVSAPPHTTQILIEDVIRKHFDWIREQLGQAQCITKHPLQLGDALMVNGKIVTLCDGPHTKPLLALTQRTLSICQDAENCIHDTVYLWVRNYAKAELSRRASMLANQFGFNPKRITVKEQRRRWGSCSTLGNINLNWRLIQAPVDVQNYVIIHELAHLKEMNHGPQFWRLVEQMMPDFEQAKAWLRRHGEELYSLQPDGVLHALTKTAST